MQHFGTAMSFKLIQVAWREGAGRRHRQQSAAAGTLIDSGGYIKRLAMIGGESCESGFLGLLMRHRRF